MSMSNPEKRVTEMFMSFNGYLASLLGSQPKVDVSLFLSKEYKVSSRITHNSPTLFFQDLSA